jgi:hypothetical protein
MLPPAGSTKALPRLATRDQAHLVSGLGSSCNASSCRQQDSAAGPAEDARGAVAACATSGAGMFCAIVLAASVHLLANRLTSAPTPADKPGASTPGESAGNWIAAHQTRGESAGSSAASRLGAKLPRPAEAIIEVAAGAIAEDSSGAR